MSMAQPTCWIMIWDNLVIYLTAQQVLRNLSWQICTTMQSPSNAAAESQEVLSKSNHENSSLGPAPIHWSRHRHTWFERVPWNLLSRMHCMRSSLLFLTLHRLQRWCNPKLLLDAGAAEKRKATGMFMTNGELCCGLPDFYSSSIRTQKLILRARKLIMSVFIIYQAKVPNCQEHSKATTRGTCYSQKAILMFRASLN